MQIVYTEKYNIYCFKSGQRKSRQTDRCGDVQSDLEGNIKLNPLCKNTEVYSCTPMYRFNIPPHGGWFYKYAASSHPSYLLNGQVS